jgi:gentisate 1,2-dioxygenase
MSTNLGTMEDLPADYRQAVQNANTTPLWPLMRKALPHDTPVPQSKACLWAYDDIRPLLLRAGCR